jgi:hypothetical protein
MSHKSLNTIRRLLVLNPSGSLPARLAALHQLKLSRRFLETLIADNSLPPKIQAEACEMLLEHFPTEPVQAAKPRKFPAPAANIETERKTPDGLTIIDAELWDILCSPGGSIPGCVRGDAKTNKPVSPTLHSAQNAKTRFSDLAMQKTGVVGSRKQNRRICKIRCLVGTCDNQLQV